MQSRSEPPDFEPRSLDYSEFLTWSTSALSCGGGALAFFSVFEGELSEATVVEAWQTLCRRHPMLGATINGGMAALQFVPLPAFPRLRVTTTTSNQLVDELLASVGDLEFPPGAPLYHPFAHLNPSIGRHAFLTVINHAAGDADSTLKLHREFEDIVRNIAKDDSGS